MSVQRLFLVAFGVMLFVAGLHPALDPDLGWHLRTGEEVLRHGIPHADPFSYTMADQPWVAHEWLSDVLLWQLYGLGGWPALIVAFAGVAAVTFALVYAASPGKPYLAAIVALVAMRAAGVISGPRPQILSYLLMAALVWLVEWVRRGRLERRWLLLAPPLVALWANLHAGYLLGVVLLATYAVGIALEGRWRRAEAPSAAASGLPRWLAAAAVVSLLAAALNPNGVALWRYPFETLGSTFMQAEIGEWQSPSFHLVQVWPFGLLMLAGAIGMILSPGRPTVTELLLFFGTAAAGLRASRHIPIFAVVAAPIVARHWMRVLGRTRWRRLADGSLLRGRPPRLLAGVHLLAAVALVWFAVDRAEQMVAIDEALRPQRLPVAAVSALEERGLTDQRVFNSYNWGGYLVWRGVPVFVDGRADLYGDAFLFRYLDTVELQPGWRAPLEDHAVDVVLVETRQPLGQALALAPGWREVYRDEVAVAYVRDDVSSEAPSR